MAGVLEDAGYSCATEAGDADVIVYNTCSIRDKAEQKVYSALGKQASAWPPSCISSCFFERPLSLLFREHCLKCQPCAQLRVIE